MVRPFTAVMATSTVSVVISSDPVPPRPPTRTTALRSVPPAPTEPPAPRPETGDPAS